MPTGPSRRQQVMTTKKKEDLVFRIENNGGHVIDYFGPDDFFQTTVSRSIVGLPVHSLLGFKSFKSLKNNLINGNSAIVSYSKERIFIKERSYELSVVEANETQCLVILEDNTEAAYAQSKLQESEKKFKDVFSSIVDVYYRTNAEREFVIMSPSIERMFGIQAKEFIGKRTSDFIKPTKADEIYKILAESGLVEDFRVSIKLPSGEFKVCSFNIEAEFDKNRNIIGTNGIIRDITKQALFENDLVTSEKKFKEIFDSISDIYIRSDKDSIVEIISPSVETVTGFKPEEVLGKKESSFYKDPNVNKLLNDHLRKHGRIRNAHGELIGKNNQVIYVSLTASANYNKNGEYIGSNGIIRDITREKKQSQLTQLNKDILEKIARENDLFEILGFTCSGIEEIYPEMICSVLLYDEGNNWLVNGAAPSLPQYFNDAVNQFPVGPTNCSCGTAAHTKKIVVVSDIANDPLWESARDLALGANLKACWSVPILSSKRKILGTFAVYYNEVREPINSELEVIKSIENILSIAIENTQNKKELVSNEERYRTLVNNSPVAILIYTKGIIKFVNQEVVRIVKANKTKELLDRNIWDLITTKGNEKPKIKKHEMPRSERQIIRLDGTAVDIEVMGTSIIYRGMPSTQLVFYDISERKALELEQNSLNEFLIKQNKQLEEFAHIASHNLRAPIANIYSLLRLYEMDSSTKNSQFVMKQLNNTSENLSETINELTEVIKTSWELNKRKQKLLFTDTLKRVKQGVSNEIASKGAVINEDFGKAESIDYPKVYLESIMQNLLSNALKYSHPKRQPVISIDTKLENDSVILRIRDNGLGIDLEKHQDKIFGLRKTFHKNENARGVGLFITKAQIESMGGTILVYSKVDKGSEFVVNFGLTQTNKN